MVQERSIHRLYVGGMAIMPGDILVGDADGLVVIRPEDAKEVAEKALKQNEAERNLLKIIDEGKWDRSNFAVTLEKMGCRSSTDQKLVKRRK